ncbi:hemolysin family protein [Cohnella hashimotonis]|uniref:Hemolysin family protein n=1 Tax=Cohnella hashimotonis TaxID=2826895 RepID=A0ABT6TVZ7_9BACL|nr:hemolysin family protein [Cohnella hashimotonis]MDI4649992.1 hemolysin family protein [Cohnella hashimotonis]
MINTIIVLALIACTAFFVAAEYAVIRVRMSRIEQMVAEGNKKASAVKQIVARLDEYLSACQLGNTLTNLALGWLGESTVEHLLSPVFGLFALPESVETVVSFVIAFLILTFLEVVVGELLPKIVAIQKAESLALALARPLMIFFKITYPFSWLLNRSARLLTGMFGMKPLSETDNTRTEAELRLILSEGYKSGIINSSEFRYVTNIFELDDMVAKGIMIPRRDVAFIDESETVQEVVARTSLDAYDLYPVTAGGDKDTVVGLIDYKELLTTYIRHPGEPDMPVKPYIEPVLQLLDTVSVQEILLLMQKKDIHMAVLLDEYGGTSGIVTIRDIIARIVGERRQQRDEDGRPLIQQLGDGQYALSGTLMIEETNRLLKTEIEDDEGVYTLGGWLMSELEEAMPGAEVSADNYTFVVAEMENRQIKRVNVRRSAAAVDDMQEAAAPSAEYHS